MTRIAPAVKSLLERPSSERRLGPFLLLEQLGRGSFAPVWLAQEVYGATVLRTAAVKLFSLEGAQGGLERERIVDEARALCQVEHPSVVRFYSLPIDAAGRVMGLAMEHVAGTSLHERLAARGRLPVEEVLAIGAAIASALSAVHCAGLVHRDVKPANVVEASGVYKLIDFGIAAADVLGEVQESTASSARRPLPRGDLPASAVGSKLEPLGSTRPTPGGPPTTAPCAVCGTVGYIDPLCVRNGDPATPSSDLYALGATLFESLTGKVPAAAGESAGLRGAVLDGRSPAPSLAAIAPETPAAVVTLIDALLDLDLRRRPRSAEWVALRFEQMQREITGGRRAQPPEEVGPFRGLGRFDEGDRDLLFGRGSELAAALQTLRSRGLLALVGPSGSGKSSLARAGVLPAVAEGGLGGWPKRWDVAVAEPGTDPRAAVAAALAPFAPRAAEYPPDVLVQALTERAQSTGWGLLLLVDQLEELTTLAAGPSRAWTVELLNRLGEQALPGLRVVVTLRRDLLDPLLALGPIGRTLVRGLLLIEPITALTWGDVVEQALGAYGYTLEDERLREALAAEIEGTAGAMPLVQFALTELWKKRDTVRKKVTWAGLQALGGLKGALERHADATLTELAGRGAREQARAALLHLTTPQGTRAARDRSALILAASPGGEEVVEALSRARLIVPGPQGLTLAHDALLTQWASLRSWVAEAREDRIFAEELERDAERWRRAPELSPLWRALRLASAEALFRRAGHGVSSSARSFLDASRRAERRGRLGGAGAALLAGTLLLAGGVVYVRALRAKEAATSLALANEQRMLQNEQRALQSEQESRRVAEKNRDAAEAQAREIRSLQAEIDVLMVKLEREPDREKRPEIEKAIRRTIEASTRVSQPADRAGPPPSPPASSSPSRPFPSALPPVGWEVNEPREPGPPGAR